MGAMVSFTSPGGPDHTGFLGATVRVVLDRLAFEQVDSVKHMDFFGVGGPCLISRRSG